MKDLNWKDAIYYGEVFGFLFAWAVCLALVMSGDQEQADSGTTETIASVHRVVPR